MLFQELDDIDVYDGIWACSSILRLPYTFGDSSKLKKEVHFNADWMQMDSSLNSSKSNKLPKWDPFFLVFAENQFGMYKLIHEKEELHKRFEACYRDMRSGIIDNS